MALLSQFLADKQKYLEMMQESYEKLKNELA